MREPIVGRLHGSIGRVLCAIQSKYGFGNAIIDVVLDDAIRGNQVKNLKNKIKCKKK